VFLGEISSSRSHYSKKDYTGKKNEQHSYKTNVECKNFELRRQTGKFEEGNAEERGVYSRCQ
jgi:hypothetical protein